MSEANAEPGSFPNVAPMLVPDSVPEPAASPARADEGYQLAVANQVGGAEEVAEASSTTPTPAPALAATPTIPLPEGPHRIVVNVLGATIRTISSSRPHLAPGRRNLSLARRT